MSRGICRIGVGKTGVLLIYIASSTGFGKTFQYELNAWILILDRTPLQVVRQSVNIDPEHCIRVETIGIEIEVYDLTEGIIAEPGGVTSNNLQGVIESVCCPIIRTVSQSNVPVYIGLIGADPDPERMRQPIALVPTEVLSCRGGPQRVRSTVRARVAAGAARSDRSHT